MPSTVVSSYVSFREGPLLKLGFHPGMSYKVGRIPVIHGVKKAQKKMALPGVFLSTLNRSRHFTPIITGFLGPHLVGFSVHPNMGVSS